ncbi:hypothetical protein HXX76_004224 [Chlamydomonas incerta]|uniref:Uncharacterized protein n=1 Tax=Chlamydomonas incerta TaxID=51695 RepID=A0A835W5G1_CHLIN|nr:hypothetical protein HXX76_004224 [Chlamydomonas incerta]|eukprot:KAG2440110.1 hypothetical protein HXX76_004224 [Chlamydomonas incerta]
MAATSRLAPLVAAFGGVARGLSAATRSEMPRPPAKRASDGGLSRSAQDASLLPRRAASGGGGFPAAPPPAQLDRGAAAPSHFDGGSGGHRHGQHGHVEGPVSIAPQHQHSSETCALRPPRRTVWAVRSAGGACPPPSHPASPRGMPPSRLGPAVTVAAAAAAAAHYRRQASCPPLAPPMLLQYEVNDVNARSRLYNGGGGADVGPPSAFLRFNGPALDLQQPAGAAPLGPPRFLSEPHTSSSSMSTFTAPPPYQQPHSTSQRSIFQAPPASLPSAGNGPAGMDGGGGACACYECLVARHHRMLLSSAPPSLRPTSAGGYRRGPASGGGATSPSGGWGPAPSPLPAQQQHPYAAAGLLRSGAAPAPGTRAQFMLAAAGPPPPPLQPPPPPPPHAVAASGPLSSSDTDMSSDGDAATSPGDAQYQAAYDAAYAAAYRAAYRAVRSAYASSSGGGRGPAPPPPIGNTHRGTPSDYVPGTPSQRH